MFRCGFLLKSKCLNFNLNSNKLYSLSGLKFTTNNNQMDMTQFWQQKNVKDILQLQRDYLSEYSPLWESIKPLYDEMGITEQKKNHKKNKDENKNNKFQK